jgi:hypothetical protein
MHRQDFWVGGLFRFIRVSERPVPRAQSLVRELIQQMLTNPIVVGLDSAPFVLGYANERLCDEDPPCFQKGLLRTTERTSEYPFLDGAPCYRYEL